MSRARTPLSRLATSKTASAAAVAIAVVLEPDALLDWDERLFRQSLAGFAAWVDEHGRWPRQQAPDAVEARFGKWLNQQRVAANGKHRSTHRFEKFDRAARLEAAVPHWRDAAHFTAAAAA